MDNGPDVVSKTRDPSANEDGVTLVFSRLGKPIGYAFVEPFNGRFRDECRNGYWFLSQAYTRAKIEARRRTTMRRGPTNCLAG
jgi:putative transposase